ncbi:MAG: hypothetical protein ACRCW1_08815, partial [Anaerotignaceae bacterium]
AISTGAKIVYNTKVANYKDIGFEYSGKLMVLKNIINTQYLWNEVRVQGGAYGCGCNFTRSGQVYTYSYRDPNISATYDRFNEISSFLKNISLGEREITQHTLGAINVLDKPKSKSEAFEMAIMRYMHGITETMVQMERDEILSVTEADIKAYSELFDKAMEKGIMCTFGSELKIVENKELFNEIKRIEK